MLPANPTGADLVAAIEAPAAAQGIRPFEVARRLSSDPRKWLKQVRAAKAPKPSTIERVAALLDCRTIPPAPPNNFQASDRRRTDIRVIPDRVGREILPDPVYREPCFKCGVRGDIGCRHRP